MKIRLFSLKKNRRCRLRRNALPDAWRSILERRVAYFRLLTPEDRLELCGHLQVLIAEKFFEGCGGLQISDEIRVTIAAQACVLLLGRETDYFPLMRSVLVYPHHFYAESVYETEDGIVHEEISDREGESWHRGPVVLSWEDVALDAAAPDDGYNVVFHEFAHQLDMESGTSDGAPPLEDRAAAGEWADVMGREYERLAEDIEKRRPHLIDDYAASDPAEFFAVVTELFFERPSALMHQHPKLYQVMRRYYRQDPATRFAAT